MGAEVAAAGVAGGIGLVGDMISSDTASDNAARQYQLAHEQMDWQSQENDKDRAWQEQFWHDQNSTQFDQQQQILNLQQQHWFEQQQAQQNQWYEQQEYNSYANQMQRARQAGLNPSAVINGSGGQIATANSSVPNGSAPSGGSLPSHGVSPSGIPQNRGANTAEFLGSLGSFIRDLSQSQLSAAQKTEIFSLLDGRVKMQDLQVIGQDLSNQFQKIENYVAENVKDNRVREKAQDVAYKISQTLLNDELSRSEARRRISADFEDLLTVAKTRLTNEQYEKFHIEVGMLPKILMAQLDEIRSSTSKNYAQAGEASANASWTRYQESMSRALEAGKMEMFWDEVYRSYNDNMMSDAELDRIKALAEQEKVAASHAESQFWRDFIMETVSQGADVFEKYARGRAALKNIKSFSTLSEAQQKSVEAKIRQMSKTNRSIQYKKVNGKWQEVSGVKSFSN